MLDFILYNTNICSHLIYYGFLMAHFEFSWATDDGVEIYGHGWEPEKPAKALVCLVHGIGEHSSRYAHVAKYLNNAGYVLLAFDHRGHGRSKGQRGFFPSYKMVMKDIAKHLSQGISRYPNIPVFLYGHSMGGNLVLNYVLRNRPNIKGIIATAPFLKVAFELSSIKQFFGIFLKYILPCVPMSNGLDTKDVSRDKQVVDDYDNDPLTHDRITPSFYHILEAGEWALHHAKEFPLPLLLMHGSEDHITSHKNTIVFAKDVGNKATLKIWDGLYHEIHNEPEQKDVLQAMVNWLDVQRVK